jgi:pullulanase/glycogen debranching enzyme
LHDLAWLQSNGTPLQGDDWQDPTSQVMGCLIGEPGLAKTPVLMLINAEQVDHSFTLPTGNWQALLDTTQPSGKTSWFSQSEHTYPLAAHSLALLQKI